MLRNNEQIPFKIVGLTYMKINLLHFLIHRSLNLYNLAFLI